MHVLTSLEKRILDNPREALTAGFGPATGAGMRFYYLDPEERELLGLTEFHNAIDEADARRRRQTFPFRRSNPHD